MFVQAETYIFWLGNTTCIFLPKALQMHAKSPPLPVPGAPLFSMQSSEQEAATAAGSHIGCYLSNFDESSLKLCAEDRHLLAFYALICCKIAPQATRPHKTFKGMSASAWTGSESKSIFRRSIAWQGGAVGEQVSIGTFTKSTVWLNDESRWQSGRLVHKICGEVSQFNT